MRPAIEHSIVSIRRGPCGRLASGQCEAPAPHGTTATVVDQRPFRSMARPLHHWPVPPRVAMTRSSRRHPMATAVDGQDTPQRKGPPCPRHKGAEHRIYVTHRHSQHPLHHTRRQGPGPVARFHLIRTVRFDDNPRVSLGHAGLTAQRPGLGAWNGHRRKSRGNGCSPNTC